MSVFDFSARLLDGEEVSLGRFADRVLVIVNTASACGFTPQYAGLQELYDRFAPRGLTVLGFPCNQFGHQEPGDSAQIAEFCAREYQVTFPMFEKIEVNGEDAHPLYKYLTRQKPGMLGASIKWNFTKFLIDRAGAVVARYAPTTRPQTLINDIEALL